MPRLAPDCSNFDSMPDIELVLGGRKTTIPPEAYIVRVRGDADATKRPDGCHSAQLTRSKCPSSVATGVAEPVDYRRTVLSALAEARHAVCGDML